MPDTGYIYHKVSAWAEVAEFGELEITQLHVEYALNTIPKGWISLALGRDAESGRRAEEHTLVGVFSEQRWIRIYIMVDGLQVKLMEGLTAGINPERTVESAGLAVDIVGWMDLLRATSASSRLFGSASQSDYVMWATGNVSGNTYATPAAMGWEFTNQLNDGLWTAAQAALVHLTTRPAVVGVDDSLQDVGVGTRTIDVPDNDLARAALDRMLNDPLLLGVEEAGIHTPILDAVGQIVFGAHGGPTVWSKILTLGSMFGFSVAPMVDEARCIAFSPYLKAEAILRSIGPDEYTWSKRTTQTPRTVRGVALLSAQPQPFYDSSGAQAGYRTVTGRYDSGKEGGVFEILTMPPWLEPTAADAEWGPKTSGIDGGGVSGNGPDIDEGEAEQVGVDNAVAAQRAADANKLGTRLAKEMWLRIVHAGRMARIAGKLRVDICPGTPLSIGLAGSKGSLYGDGRVYAAVNRVSIDVSAPQSSASTSFDLIGVRTEAEEEQAALEHPLFGVPFTGQPLWTAEESA